MANKICEEIRLQVVQLKKLGKTYSEISEELNIGKSSVSNICKEFNLGQSYIELTQDKIEECQKLYDEIGNIKTVAKLVNISYKRLREVITFKTSTKTNYDYVKDRRRKVKELLVNYKGGKCEICGYDKCLGALDFHHINSKDKDFSISSSNVYNNIDKLKSEVDKCILVCANCHREIHYDTRDCSGDAGSMPVDADADSLMGESARINNYKQSTMLIGSLTREIDSHNGIVARE